MTLNDIRYFVDRSKDLPDDTPVFTRWGKGGGPEEDVSIYTDGVEEFDDEMREALKDFGLENFRQIVVVWHG